MNRQSAIKNHQSAGGYAGKILRLNLTERKASTIPTSDYAQWGGGHGMGSAIFFDLVKDKTIDGFDPANVVTIMTSPLCGTLVPAAGGRTEVQGIGVQSYPIGWFTRSNFGGRFSAQLKYAGWDGIVIEGRADEPVWADIRDGDVQLRSCKPLSLWGKDTRECQERIWDYVAGSGAYGDWIRPGGEEKGQTTQRPAVLAIGPAGENLSRLACLMHDAGNSSGQGGFGGVWGSKRLKAISVIGTGHIPIHDPRALLEARIWQQENYAFDPENPWAMVGTVFPSPPRYDGVWVKEPVKEGGRRPSACVGCHSGCKGRYEDGLANEATCQGTMFYMDADTRDIQRRSSDLLNRYGLNAFELWLSLPYIRGLQHSGELGPGKAIDCPLDFDDYGSLAFIERFVKMIAYRNDGLRNPHPFGDDLAEGIIRAAEKWGRLEGDLASGRLQFPFWGLPKHRDPGWKPDWDYGSVLGDRDINEHGFDRFSQGRDADGRVVQIYTDKMVPFQGDRLMLDFSKENMYSEHIAKLISWHRYYTRFYKQSLLFCDWRWPDFVNRRAPGNVGSTGEAEPKFLNAVTGKNLTFLDGIELGKKIWNLDHAIWTLQGRHRDMVRFADFVYHRVDKDRFEAFKTRFYALQGWDTQTGFPKRRTLAHMGLGYVADELKAQGKLGA